MSKCLCAECGVVEITPTYGRKYCSACAATRKKDANRKGYYRSSGATPLVKEVECVDCSKQITRTVPTKVRCKECQRLHTNKLYNERHRKQ